MAGCGTYSVPSNDTCHMPTVLRHARERDSAVRRRQTVAPVSRSCHLPLTLRSIKPQPPFPVPHLAIHRHASRELTRGLVHTVDSHFLRTRHHGDAYTDVQLTLSLLLQFLSSLGFQFGNFLLRLDHHRSRSACSLASRSTLALISITSSSALTLIAAISAIAASCSAVLLCVELG